MTPLRRSHAGTLLLAAAGALLPSCGGDEPSDPTALDVKVVYVSRIVGCPAKDDPCYPMCIHGATPAGVRIVPVWPADAIRLASTQTAGLYDGTLAAVPTNTVLRLYGTDPGTCCINACSPPSVVDEIQLNGTKLTTVVYDSLPTGATAALQFTLKGDGTIQN